MCIPSVCSSLTWTWRHMYRRWRVKHCDKHPVVSQGLWTSKHVLFVSILFTFKMIRSTTCHAQIKSWVPVEFLWWHKPCRNVQAPQVHHSTCIDYFNTTIVCPLAQIPGITEPSILLPFPSDPSDSTGSCLHHPNKQLAPTAVSPPART